ncbi:hypothetical protein IWQ47_000957 [Aquimarina sp. EL_43]|uniref:hypothetical protein n=1 Tax=Aquimarina TaxID=290174 RepID=UPI00047054FA|nr:MULTISPECIES: hypothetical protein [Aquimarina]MBG6129741.1 hypothetical protein [Aquimarina sp. EL_35]MBG6150806.1 hypothetical protein [Aquimarina sp. EL_32]MBG6167887.1 hypothetical protein [Aquimarina sp. EL_43]
MKNINRVIIFTLNFLIIIQANAKETNRLAVVANDKAIITSVKKNTDTEPKSKKTKKAVENKSFHSIKKWKITIEYTDGGIMSKTIVVQESSDLSALETAFLEAEKYMETIENIKNYEVSPVSKNSFVLLAGGI